MQKQALLFFLSPTRTRTRESFLYLVHLLVKILVGQTDRVHIFPDLNLVPQNEERDIVVVIGLRHVVASMNVDPLDRSNVAVQCLKKTLCSRNLVQRIC